MPLWPAGLIGALALGQVEAGPNLESGVCAGSLLPAPEGGARATSLTLRWVPEERAHCRLVLCLAL